MTKVTHLTLDERGELSKRRVHLREISGDADAPLDAVGKDLRAARLRRGDELAAVARALRIRKDHLEAIEEDRFEALPGRTYAVGFVRTYAAYLGLDSKQCVERFKKEIAGRVDGAPQVGLAPETSESRLPRGWQMMAFVVIGVVAYGAYHLARSADRLSIQPVAPVPARIATPDANAHGYLPNNRLAAPRRSGMALAAAIHRIHRRKNASAFPVVCANFAFGPALAVFSSLKVNFCVQARLCTRLVALSMRV